MHVTQNLYYSVGIQAVAPDRVQRALRIRGLCTQRQFPEVSARTTFLPKPGTRYSLHAPDALLTRHFVNLHAETAQRILKVLVATLDVAKALNGGLPLCQHRRDEVGKTGA